MRSLIRQPGIVALGAMLSAVLSPAPAQSRVLPAGTVIIVKTTVPLESGTAQVGQTFETTVDQDVAVDAYTVIPAGSRVRGSITMARAATRAQSGVIDVHFDRLTAPNGTPIAINGKLTSTDSAERRQINADPNAHVVLVGQRGGIGAAIAGAGGSQSSNSILSALGGLLSEGRDVSVPAGTPLAVELTQNVSLRGGRRAAGASSASTLYTDPNLIRAAQQNLARRNYYRGNPTGTMDNATRRALFSFQIDNGLTGTGNLDGRTAELLGLSLTGSGGAAMAGAEASALRRDAQTLLARYRSSIGIDNNGRGTVAREYTQSELEVLFALSSFTDNASVYEQLARASENQSAAVSAGRALINAARRVDAAIGADASVSADVRNTWTRMRQALSAFEAANPG